MGKMYNKPTLLPNRRQLRTDGTSAEAVLWKRLQKAQLKGRKFRRQHSIDNYILDFYCPEERLAIELDGAHHFTQAGSLNDSHRDQHLASLDIRVLRFENRLVFQHIDAVIAEIESHFAP
ncbi:MAG TPA: endonuclease domain-containing protein [Chitinophagales bacterium]|nr:endonuclease domain-containing protein [Chitinophagales bacterium]